MTMFKIEKLTEGGTTVLRLVGRINTQHPRTRGGRCLICLMTTMLEVQPEIASKIQARARERGVSVDVYLRELIDQKGTESERSNGLSPQERVRLLREWALGHSRDTPVLSENVISRESIYEERG